MRRTLTLLTLTLLGTAGAAGILATPGRVEDSAFCRKNACRLVDQTGRDWEYTLRVPGTQSLVVTRESGEAGSRITALSLHSANDDVNADLDRSTLRDLQTLALGFVSNNGRIENCYALDGAQIRVLADAPDERTRRIYCDWNEGYTEFTIEADRNYLARTAPSQVTLTSGPTGLNQWYFRNCDAGGTLSGYLPTGKAARCDLTIETKGAHSQVVRAEFQYEIEYIQNGQAVKRLLPEKEVWLPGRAPGAVDPVVRQQGRTITANLSLKVRDVPGRRVTSLNTIATLTFANGVIKRAYEPLQVR